MSYQPDNPLIVQSDRSILLEVSNPKYAEARDALSPFAELVKSPEYIHSYRITPLSLWNAAAAGHALEDIIASLEKFGKYDIPGNIRFEIEDYYKRYGRLVIEPSGTPNQLLLKSDSENLLTELISQKAISCFAEGRTGPTTLLFPIMMRGVIKQALIKIGFPAEDLAGYTEGDPFPFKLREVTLIEKKPFGLRDYQINSAAAFYAAGSRRGGSGVIVLPCGAGKTIVGMAAMHFSQTKTLILTTNITAAHQWKREILDKTDIPENEIGEYTGEEKLLRSITIATYQIVTYRKKKSEEYPHFDIFGKLNWGLIVYDEVHLLPAPVFRITAMIQAKRRLGLTATLVREDNREDEVFTLIGPKKYDAPWKDLEKQGWIATAECTEIRIDLPNEMKLSYATADNRKKIRMAAENPNKLDIVEYLFEMHKDDLVLVIGQYLDQIDNIAKAFGLPVITGATPNSERDELYEKFRSGKMKRLIVSKVGNFAVDLPDANVAIQVSGTFGSRQEEAQRLGRILRPKSNQSVAKFYSLVTRDTREQEFAMNRQLFLTEQGYNYTIVNAEKFVK
ncbi:MAG: DEAD/DEAH box helicase [Fibrobacteres bacterium]|nr:DEAD/DEAH box helicase [Fibrobacterota bacterium]